MNTGVPALLHDTYGYQIPNEDDVDSLEQQHRSFASHPPAFENEGPAAALFRASEPSSLNQSSIHPLSLHAGNGFDYRPPSGSNASGSDLPFQPVSGLSMIPLGSNRGSASTSHSPSGSSYAYLGQHNHQYSINPNVSYHGIASHPSAPSVLYPPAANYSQTSLQGLDVRPRLNTLTPNSGMPPPSRNSTVPSPVSPPIGSTFRGDYSAHLPRHPFTPQGNIYHVSSSPQSPLSAMSRSLDSSAGRESPSGNAHFGFGGSMRINPSDPLSGSQSVPPFDPTKPFYSLSDGRGHTVLAEIQAKIDKGFFRADSDWTCYRRNYFSVACAYGLKTDVEIDPDQVFLHRQNSNLERCQAFAVCIAAKVDGEDGKPIELVQHTPKRDKGPMSTPEKRELKPNPSGNLSVFTGSAGFNPSQLHSPDMDHMYHGTSENHNVANFERIQFKKATANNGKRRAAQQYFHIVVELYAKISKNKSDDHDWVKIAHRISAQMVVRGRSPGHYSDERRGSSTSMGPGSGAGGDLGGYHPDPSGSGPLMLGGLRGHSRYTNSGGGYQTHHSSMTHSPPSDCPSIPSSASSITSGALHEIVQQPSSLNIDDESMDGFYDHQNENDFHSSYPRHGPVIIGSATEGSPPSNDTFSYMTSPIMKDDLHYLKSGPARQTRLRAPFSPTSGPDWAFREAHNSSKDCGPVYA